VSEPEEFVERLLARVLADTHRHQRGVTASGGFVVGEPPAARRRLANAVAAVMGRVGFTRRRFVPEQAAGVLTAAIELADGLARTEELLADARSRELMLTVFSLRALGPGHVKLPVSEWAFNQECARIDRDLRVIEDAARSPLDLPLHRYELRGRHGPVAVLGLAFLVQEFFVRKQYALRRDGVRIEAEPGDVVVDGGGGWGETALYFADAVGADGRVLCFEFVPENLELLQLNLAANLGLREQIEVVEHPLWDNSGELLEYTVHGGQSSLVWEGPERDQARTESLDEACRKHGVPRVDFLKLDVEGAELAALRGAEEVIRRSRPKLAVSVYHHEADFAQIPAWIDDLGLGYELFLDHKGPGPAETILFARTPRSANR